MPFTTKTIVLTDLADYTQTTSENDHLLLRRLVEVHESHTEAIVGPYGGMLSRNLGDSFMVLFDSATQALHACMELVSTTLDLGNDIQLKFRASAATGDVDLLGDYFIGEAVNLSARINSQIPAGEVWFADRTRLCMNHSEIPWEPVGTFDFKGIPERVECFRAVPAGQCILADSLKTAASTDVLKVIRPSDLASDLAVGPEHQAVLVGFEPDSEPLQDAIQRLSTHLIPSRISMLVNAIPTAARVAWMRTGRGLVVGEETAFLESVSVLQDGEKKKSTSTVFIDLSDTGSGKLELAGLGLPAVPIAGMINGYSFDLHEDGAWNFDREGSLLEVEVDASGVHVTAFGTETLVNGTRLGTNERRLLADGDTIELAIGAFQFTTPGGIYAGLLTGPAPHCMSIEDDVAVELGRDPEDPGFILPDRGGLDRIQWAPVPKAEKAKRAGLTLDRSMMGRRQAEIKTSGDGQFTVTPVHERIPTWIIRSETIERLKAPADLSFGDLIVMGTYVVRITEPA